MRTWRVGRLLLLWLLCGLPWPRAQAGEPAGAITAATGPAINLERPLALTIVYDVEAPRKVNARARKTLQIGDRTR